MSSFFQRITIHTRRGVIIGEKYLCVCPIVPLLLFFFSLLFCLCQSVSHPSLCLPPPPQKKEEKGNNIIKVEKDHQMLPKRDKKNDDDDEDIFSKTQKHLSRQYLRDFEERQAALSESLTRRRRRRRRRRSTTTKGRLFVVVMGCVVVESCF